jgi:polynucleotide 5'-kinase involved in rRNA processing
VSVETAVGSGGCNGERARLEAEPPTEVPLSATDLVPDRRLTDAAKDKFDHAQIARRVAELVASAEPPLNVAVFGPWGSGKSSLAGLIDASLRERWGSVALIRYDAWK